MKMTVSVLAVLLLCAVVAAQDLPRIAVYVTGNVGADEKKALGTRMLASLVNSGRYTGIERSNTFLAEIEKEQVKQRSGAIDDSQISELGRQFGVKFVCIADITPAFGEFQVSARIVNVETAVVAHIGESSGQLASMDDLSRISDEVVGNMFGGKITSAPIVPVPVPVPVQTLPPPPTASETTSFDDMFCLSEKGMTLTTAIVIYKPVKAMFYARTNVVDVTGTADKGTVFLATQTFDKKMRTSMKGDAVKSVVNIHDGVVVVHAAQKFREQGTTIFYNGVITDPFPLFNTFGKIDITVETPEKLPSKLAVGDILPNAGYTVKIMNSTINVRMTERKCIGIETVTVPAGAFECYKIEQKLTMIDGIYKPTVFYHTTWYARGVGIVKTTRYTDKGKQSAATELQKIERVSDRQTR